jgi:hypothetical protein
MRKSFYLSAIFLAFVILFSSQEKAYAQYGEIWYTCDATGCSLDPSDAPMFSMENMAPGDYVIRGFTVKNDRDLACEVAIEADVSSVADSSELSRNLYTSVVGDGYFYYGSRSGDFPSGDSTMHDFLTRSEPLILGTIADRSIRDYFWTVYLSPSTGNEFQGKTASFSLNIGVSCPPEAGATGLTPIGGISSPRSFSWWNWFRERAGLDTYESGEVAALSSEDSPFGLLIQNDPENLEPASVSVDVPVNSSEKGEILGLQKSDEPFDYRPLLIIPVTLIFGYIMVKKAHKKNTEQ